MTKEQFIELMWRKVGGDTEDTTKYDKRLVELHIANAWGNVLYDTFRQDLSNLDFYVKEQTSVAINQDTTTDKYYSELPITTVQLPDRAEGVRHISTKQGTGMEFVPVSERDSRLMDSLEVGLVSDKIGYTVLFDRVWYTRNMTTTIAAAGVRMSIVPSFDAMDSDDPIVPPSGKGAMLEESVYKLLMNILDKDLLNTNE